MSKICITLDIDWAPDFIIDYVAELLIAKNVKATWFATHCSDAVERLKERPDLFEIGIHPNFFEGSSHGNSIEEVFNTVLNWFPDAVSIRSHGVYQSGRWLNYILKETDLKVDSTIFMPYVENIQPFYFQSEKKSLLRVPFFWADDYELGQENPCWDLKEILENKGEKVLLFHPVHIYLNSKNFISYEKIKDDLSNLKKLNITDENRDFGVKIIFCELLEFLSFQRKSCLIRDYQNLNSFKDAVC